MIQSSEVATPNQKKETLREIFKTQIDLFAEFVFEKHCKLTTPKFHKEIYDILQLPEKTKAIAAPRGFAKSTIVDLVYASWCIAYGKKHFIIILSDSYTQSEEFVNTLKNEIEHNERFRWLYGNLISDRWSLGEFETKNEIKVTAKGQGMKIRGLKFRQWRPDLLIIDDLENDEAVSSLERRKKLKSYFLRGVMPAMSQDGEIIIIGTILHWDSLLKKIIDGRDEFGGWLRKKYIALSYDENNKPISLWPEAWPAETLIKMRSDPTFEKYLGSIVFEQEYQNSPRSEDDVLIKPDWIKFYDELPNNLEIVTAIDPAISKKETADYSAITTWGKTVVDGKPKFYCLNTVNKRLNFAEIQREAKIVDERFKPRAMLVEVVQYQEALKEILTGLPIESVTPDKDKVRRLLVVQPLFEAGQVYLRRDQIELFDQLTQFTGIGDEHDDLVDSTVYALNWFSESKFSFSFGDKVFKKEEWDKNAGLQSKGVVETPTGLPWRDEAERKAMEDAEVIKQAKESEKRERGGVYWFS